jgi:hypothetical protein
MNVELTGPGVSCQKYLALSVAAAVRLNDGSKVGKGICNRLLANEGPFFGKLVAWAFDTPETRGEEKPPLRTTKHINMKRSLATLLVLIPFAVPAQAAVIFGGDFQMYKPGTGYTVTATFTPDSFAKGVGDGIELSGGTVDYSDGTSGTTVDMPGWEPLNGDNDLVPNGVGGSTGANFFAAWGNNGRIQSADSLFTVQAGQTVTISTMVGGPDGGPISGPLAFHLLADGVQVTPTSSVDPFLPNNGEFQMISRTYDATALAGHIGASTQIVVGVEDANAEGNRVIFDDVSLDVVPEPASSLLLGMGGLALVFSRSRKK